MTHPPLIGREDSNRRFAFPRQARMLKADDFSSAFRMRPCGRSEHFVVHVRYTGQPARLGLVLGKKSAPRAATRNLVRRLAREQFRLRRDDLLGCDVLIRMHSRYDKVRYPGAARAALKVCVHDELRTLLQASALVAAKRRRVQKLPATAHASVTPETLHRAVVEDKAGAVADGNEPSTASGAVKCGKAR